VSAKIQRKSGENKINKKEKCVVEKENKIKTKKSAWQRRKIEMKSGGVTCVQAGPKLAGAAPSGSTQRMKSECECSLYMRAAPEMT
jgi:hypothetical protein